MPLPGIGSHNVDDYLELTNKVVFQTLHRWLGEAMGSQLPVVTVERLNRGDPASVSFLCANWPLINKKCYLKAKQDVRPGTPIDSNRNAKGPFKTTDSCQMTQVTVTYPCIHGQIRVRRPHPPADAKELVGN